MHSINIATALLLTFVFCPLVTWADDAGGVRTNGASTNSTAQSAQSLRYAIPSNALEKLVPLSSNETWCSRKAEYWLHDQKVGERRWWKNGRLSDEHPMRDGLLHGVSRWWRDDGQRLLSEHSYQHGLLHGVSKAWDSKGTLTSEVSYITGKRDGTEKKWNSNGELVWELPYKEGKLHGIARYWKQHAQLQLPDLLAKAPRPVSYWVDGREVSRQEYSSTTRTNSNLRRPPESK